ncbi:flagellar basal body-associated FliL family protein [Rhodoferax antarcticus]|uniref:flagellar basal body-associated FliL family protein n=1 Tax=Rhodoferax antarcticus TaxID=81479 RepID=UPI00222580D2|nr:flagellar basal body-associated FliL family protein [Rhodoferax antarcticus]MCW2312777.1 flagellar FliL protein [Rhodoferax antarcticus]
MATKPEVAEAVVAKPAKSKKMLIIIIAAVVVLALGGGGAFLYISKQRAAAAAAFEDEGGGESVANAAGSHDDKKTLPVYLPMDNMVVNLADEGGDRVAQVGITLQLRDAKASEIVKAYMPIIRSSVLMLLSQRTAVELLSAEGKQKLIEDILLEASRPFGGGSEAEPEPGKKVRKKAKVEYPVVGVLFSSLIVQ